ncbi:hypothetical protein [Methylobacterium haplocladii]|uniref:Uncharacterized protein n=1 Tax=Methylobacterium haplocladii TaxID=1176176 RepID=A0A512IK54_9HYPH|nr:hypothetical protein [Methylobacterium haplocladii]GEO98055.1 hypothetical protein MHA02_04430 [Methylobacterium haplocladii]GLS60100.1 hypothetical protein GCM10007887_27770 [Methylobacterium haplocladii]
MADELLPLLRESLTESERRHLVDMLNRVAGAHSSPSELQREAVARLKRRLLPGTSVLKTRRSGDVA